jgi:glycosyltransferase involved in cell wall biosynthesis
LKVLHVIPTLSSLSGGPAEAAINLVKHLNLLGAEAVVLTTDDNGNDRFDVPLKELTIYREIPVLFFPRINPRLKEFIISPSAIKWLSNNLMKYDILDIHYLFSFVPLMARSMARRREIPYTVRTMGQLSPWALQQSTWRKKLFFKLQEFKNLQQASGLHSTSKGEEKDIRSFGLSTPVINIPLGVQQPKIIKDAVSIIRAKYNINHDAFILLFLSRLHYKKRPKVVIDVVADLRQKYNIHLIMAGSGEPSYVKELMNLTSDLQLGDSVSFTGFVEGKEKDELLQGANLFVLPSYSENFGIAVAESLAAGTPVVITPEVQIAEYVDAYQAGIIAEGDKNSLVNAITNCIENKPMMNKFRENSLRLAQERFNWSSIAMELLESYRLILRSPKS